MYYEMNKMNNSNYNNSQNIINGDIHALKVIIATQDYHSLSHWILYGKIDSIAKNTHLLQQLIDLCEANKWTKGLRLLNSCKI